MREVNKCDGKKGRTPTPRACEGIGLRDRQDVEAGVCGSHQGPGIVDSHQRGRIYASNQTLLVHHNNSRVAKTGRTIYALVPGRENTIRVFSRPNDSLDDRVNTPKAPPQDSRPAPGPAILERVADGDP